MRRIASMLLGIALAALLLGPTPASAAGLADISVSVSASPKPVTADSDLTYTVTVHNAGPDAASHVVFTDTLPPEVIFRSASAPGSYSPATNRVTWGVGTVSAGGSVTGQVVVTPIHPYPSGITTTATATTATTDPTTPDTASDTTVVASEPGVQYIAVRDSGLIPTFRKVPLGGTLQWDFFGPSVHEITDAHGLGLIDSGPVSPIAYFRYTFHLTAEIRTMDIGFPANNGKIVVPPVVSPLSGTPSTAFSVMWADQPLPSGIVEDVQIRRPDGKGWVPFAHSTSLLGTSFSPDAGAGSYAFRDRIRNEVTGNHSRFGPPVPFNVTD
ncbi:MAG: DUF11 domain-containing protein [Actinomycetota bacterium]